MRVIIAGSRRIVHLSDQVKSRLQNIVDRGMTVMVGDANGCDRAAQAYFAAVKYGNVEVYCMNGVPRNNLGPWPVKSVISPKSKVDFKFYAKKDEAMCAVADYGFFIWDGKSKGTLNDALMLLERGKKSLLYFAPKKNFYVLGGPGDLSSVLRCCSPDDVDRFNVDIAAGCRIGAMEMGVHRNLGA